MGSESRRTMTKKPKMKKSPSEEAVLARARRLAKAHLKPVLDALGLESFDEKLLQEKLQELKQSREAGLNDSEKHGLRVKELEKALAESRRLQGASKLALVKLQKQIEAQTQTQARSEIERKVGDVARSAGCLDSEYATHLFKQHVLSGGAHKEDPEAFFSSLKKDTQKSHLFQPAVVGAGSQSLRSAVPKTDTAIDNAVPAPVTQEIVKDEAEVEKLTPAQFNKRTQERYGYRPGL
jgi:hypothetical protein